MLVARGVDLSVRLRHSGHLWLGLVEELLEVGMVVRLRKTADLKHLARRRACVAFPCRVCNLKVEAVV